VRNEAEGGNKLAGKISLTRGMPRGNEIAEDRVLRNARR